MFSFNGTWSNENNLSCASLLLAAGGTSTIWFKDEARDSAGNPANAGVPPTTAASYARPTAVTVSSHSPGTATLNQATTFTYCGQNLVAGMGFTVTNCDTTTDFGGSSSSLSFSCIPRATGNQTFTIKDTLGGTPLYNGNPFVASPPTNISGYSPSVGSRGATVNVTVFGTSLRSTLALAITDLVCNNAGSGSSTSKTIPCSIGESLPIGSRAVTIKDQPGETTLFSAPTGFTVQ